VHNYVVLLRGVNVGGKNLLPMKSLKECLEKAGYLNVQTYIQSGNVVLDADRDPADELGPLIEKVFGFEPDVMVISKARFNAALANNPFDAPGNTVHFYFCRTAPQLDQARLEALRAESERTALDGDVFYLHAPDGIGRSKLVSRMESCLGVSATGRNLNTVSKIQRMLGT